MTEVLFIKVRIILIYGRPAAQLAILRRWVFATDAVPSTETKDSWVRLDLWVEVIFADGTAN